MNDEIVLLLYGYLQNGKLNPADSGLQTSKESIKQVEKDLATTCLKPRHIQVKLNSGKYATICLFDIKYMVLSFICDIALIKDTNIAEGYYVFTGEVDDNHHHNDNYGEVHT